MKFYRVFLFIFLGLMELSSCDSSSNQNKIKSPANTNESEVENKSPIIVKDSTKSANFTTANTSGNFSEGKGSEKKKSTEKPNRTRVSQDLTHPFQTPVEFVDEPSDPAFHYSNPNECEIILADTLQ